MRRGVRQSNDNNICPTCGERFRSSRAFDMHRTGEYGRVGPDGRYLSAQRRCLTVNEMREAGMLRNTRGLWITKAFGIASPFAPGADAIREGRGM
ncbi:hypothetical protein AMS56_13025 [Burkholderia pseudomallei]|nr:hypothetical protein UQ47_06920 [Burkholderia pseudomallei]ALC57627.1 hypothetical protein AMS56_13025 [Burkholderia pseudomallei]